VASIRFDFENRAGHKLSGVLETGESEPRAWAVYAHCFTCGKASLAAVRVSRDLAARGIGVLRFDFSGLGDSEGEFGAGLTSDAADVVDAALAMGEAGMTVGLLVGHSFGGAAVIAAASSLPDIKAVATIAAPASADHVLKDVPADLGDLAEGETREVVIQGRTFRFGAGFVRDVLAQDQAKRIATLGRALLVLHSPLDQTVGVDNASRIFLPAHHPKSFVSLDHADHLLTKASDADYAAGVIAAWASRYLGHQALIETQPASGVVRVEETGHGSYQNLIKGAGWRLLADEPVAVGGLASGPSPHDLLTAGLGACTSMTCRMYADRKGWALRHTTVEVVHTGRSETSKDLFERRIRFEGDLDETQRERLFEIADRCPVHRTLTEGSVVTTTAMVDD
jgi:uncharacterized OsmC-like protein/alpha/beta superfamily hydrolase